jgi:hypothetical protein
MSLNAGEVVIESQQRLDNASPIYCDCCGQEKLGEVRDDKLVLMDRRHGKMHMAVVILDNLRVGRVESVKA